MKTGADTRRPSKVSKAIPTRRWTPKKKRQVISPWMRKMPSDTATIKNTAATVRAQTVGHIRKNRKKHAPFYDDLHRGLAFNECLVECSNPTYWINAFLLHALSEKLGVPWCRASPFRETVDIDSDLALAR